MEGEDGGKEGGGERGANALGFRDSSAPAPMTEPLSTAALGRLLAGPDSSSLHTPLAEQPTFLYPLDTLGFLWLCLQRGLYAFKQLASGFGRWTTFGSQDEGQPCDGLDV